MPSLQWSEALSLNLPIMDDTHVEFVEMLGTVEDAPEDQLLNLWYHLIEHTRAHFSREDDWMVRTHFSSCHCHTGQHHVVLKVMEEIGLRAAKGELHLIKDLSKELGQWFSQHAQSMDAALALHMRRVGYDPETGIIHNPDQIVESNSGGCGVHADSAAEATAEEAIAA